MSKPVAAAKSKTASSKPAGIETVAGSIYDYPVYYDVIFGADWKKETEFLQAAFKKHEIGRASCRERVCYVV